MNRGPNDAASHGSFFLLRLPRPIETNYARMNRQNAHHLAPALEPPLFLIAASSGADAARRTARTLSNVHSVHLSTV